MINNSITKDTSPQISKKSNISPFNTDSFSTDFSPEKLKVNDSCLVKKSKNSYFNRKQENFSKNKKPLINSYVDFKKKSIKICSENKYKSFLMNNLINGKVEFRNNKYIVEKNQIPFEGQFNLKISNELNLLKGIPKNIFALNSSNKKIFCHSQSIEPKYKSEKEIYIEKIMNELTSKSHFSDLSNIKKRNLVSEPPKNKLKSYFNLGKI